MHVWNMSEYLRLTREKLDDGVLTSADTCVVEE